MVRTLPPAFFQYLGTTTNGDYGPFTMYRSKRGKLVFFPKTWPKDPATYNQTLNRNRWRHAGQRWRDLEPATRALWKQLGKRANLTISGYNLFIFYMMGKGTKAVDTLQRNTGIDVLTPTGAPLPFLKL